MHPPRVFTAKSDRPYFDAWLRRTRKQLSASGRLSQVALVLSREEGDTPEEWRSRLQEILDGGQQPSFELLTRIDSILTGPARENPPQQEQPTLW